MVYVPQQATMAEMIRVNVGIWIEKLPGETEGYLLIKLPSHVIKSISVKKNIEVNIRIASIGQKSFQGMAVRVYDDPDDKNPIEVTFFFSTDLEYELFANMVQAHQLRIQFFDERIMMRTMPHHVMSATGSLTVEQKEAIEVALASKFSNNTTPIKTLEEFSRLTQNSSSDKPKILANVDTQIELREIQFMTSYEAPLFSELRLNSKDEGGGFEALIYGCLYPLFPERTYHSPYNSKGKELADILCVDDGDRFICFVQAKALSVLGDAKRLAGQRIEKLLLDSNPQKPGKAIRQASGTIREIRSGQKVFKEVTRVNEISIPDFKSSTIHGLILVFEMHPAVDWKRVAKLLIDNSSKADKVFIHVIDLEELQRIAMAMPTAQEFNKLLTGRWNTMEIEKNAHVVVEFINIDQDEDL